VLRRGDRRTTGCVVPTSDRSCRARVSGIPANENRSTVLTHCKPGCFATVDWGTALRPHLQGPPRVRGPSMSGWNMKPAPRNQGASLTAFRASSPEGFPPTRDRRQRRWPPDFAAAELRGNAVNRRHRSQPTRQRRRLATRSVPISKALAAFDNGVPLRGPCRSTIDWTLCDGVAENSD